MIGKVVDLLMVQQAQSPARMAPVGQIFMDPPSARIEEVPVSHVLSLSPSGSGFQRLYSVEHSVRAVFTYATCRKSCPQCEWSKRSATYHERQRMVHCGLVFHDFPPGQGVLLVHLIVLEESLVAAFPLHLSQILTVPPDASLLDARQTRRLFTISQERLLTSVRICCPRWSVWATESNRTAGVIKGPHAWLVGSALASSSVDIRRVVGQTDTIRLSRKTFCNHQMQANETFISPAHKGFGGRARDFCRKDPGLLTNGKQEVWCEVHNFRLNKHIHWSVPRIDSRGTKFANRVADIRVTLPIPNAAARMPGAVL
eukprot:124935-Prorocentrum_minimum.AAC.3